MHFSSTPYMPHEPLPHQHTCIQMDCKHLTTNLDILEDLKISSHSTNCFKQVKIHLT